MSNSKNFFDSWKENLGSTRPWDFANPNTEYASEELKEARFDICKACPSLIKATSQCKKCGCIMSLKTKLQAATCPLEKW